MKIATHLRQRVPRSCRAICSPSAAVLLRPRGSPVSDIHRCIAAATSGVSWRIVSAAGGACAQQSIVTESIGAR
eukprot:2386441-Prymnesium_polylepis.1